MNPPFQEVVTEVVTRNDRRFTTLATGGAIGGAKKICNAISPLLHLYHLTTYIIKIGYIGVYTRGLGNGGEVGRWLGATLRVRTATRRMRA